MNPLRVLIVGDAMLDHYWDGSVDRISPEAPVPILKIGSQRTVPGGAANVAVNLAALGAEVTLLTLLGCDAAAEALQAQLLACGVRVEPIADAGYTTTQKIRLVSRRQQLLRADIEVEPPPQMLTALMQRFETVLPGHQLLLLSDYAKGALRECQPLLRQARARGLPVLVDPKGANCARYAGATLLKPNLAEFRRWSGDFDASDQDGFCRLAAGLRQKLQVEHLLVTRGEAGMSLFSAGRIHHQPASVREVYDVSGAGDTVLATLAYMMGRGSSVAEAMRWASAAAGIVVGKFGTSAVSRDELEGHFNG